MARQIRKQIRRTHKTRSSAVLGALTIVALLVLSAAPAFAHHKADHSQGGGKSASASDHDGDADSDSSTAYTEDNDTNDGNTPNNVSDDGNAHPSGKDRSVEKGGSGNQGKSESNPDDSKGPMRFEGARGDDKPNGPGGTDLADQDGNNGCGNDDDFDDDNNGWCGKNKEEDVAVTVIEDEGTVHVRTDEVEGTVHVRTDKVLPRVVRKANVLAAQTNAARPVARSAKVQGAVLPFTGGNVLSYLVAGLGLLALGTLVLRLRTDS